MAGNYRRSQVLHPSGAARQSVSINFVRTRGNQVECTILHYEALGVKVQHVAPSNRHSESRTFSPKISDNINFSIVHTLRSRMANSG
jgi:hypothetical protein